MNKQITVSAPGKIHLLGEHAVVYGKPALLTTVDLRVTVHLRGEKMSLHLGGGTEDLKKIIEPIMKKGLNIQKIPPYTLNITSDIPIGAGLGSSAAVSAAYIGALLSFLKAKWDLNLINKLAYEAEKVFHGNPSGGDNSTVVFGGLVWFRKESPDLKLLQPIPFTIPQKLAKNFILINTGKPNGTTKQMVELVKSKVQSQKSKMWKIFDNQEQLVRELLPAIQTGNEKEFMRIIKEGEKNLEKIGVVSPSVKSMIRKIESTGGVGKICGAGGKTGPTGVLLCYHPQTAAIADIAKSLNLDYFRTTLGVEGLRLDH